jgi:hypothetical protein
MEKIKIGKWDAIVFFDKENDLHTITYDGKGGAIISDTDLEVAKTKFVEAMNLAESVKKLLHFKEHGTLS